MRRGLLREGSREGDAKALAKRSRTSHLPAMREDMDKVIVERPRGGAGWARKGRPGRDLENLPLHENGKHRQRSKFLSENLAPLQRFIAAQAGRPWDKVYSEIRERVKPGNTVQEHVLTHIPDLIAMHAERVDPSEEYPCGLGNPSQYNQRLRPLLVGEPYVDPDTGLVQKAKRKIAVSRKKAARDRLWIGAGRLALRREGVWFGVDVETFTTEAAPGPNARYMIVAGRRLLPAHDPIEGPICGHDADALRRLAARYGPSRIGVKMIQLSKKDLRAHGLENATTT